MIINPTSLAALFTTPLLAGLGAAALSIPIIIHLLSRRPRKPMPWAAMKFLLAAYKKHRMRLQAESLILLLVRCLIVLLLGFALAQPLLNSSGLADQLGGSSRTILIVIDNGLSTSAKSPAGTTRFDELKKQAQLILASLGPTDQAGLITTAKPATGQIIPATAETATVTSQLNSLQPSPAASDIPAALQLAQDTLKNHPDQTRKRFLFLLSDFSKGAADIDQPLSTELADLAKYATLITFTGQETKNNIQIAQLLPDRRVAVPETPGTAPTVQWRVQLRRLGQTPAGQTSAIRLSAPGQTEERRVITWQAGQSTQELTFPTLLNTSGPMIFNAELEPADRNADSIDLDNARTAITEVRKTLNALILARNTPADARFSPQKLIQFALSPTTDPAGWAFKTHTEDPATLDQTMLADTSIVFALQPDLLDDQAYTLLQQFVQDGGLVFFTPSPAAKSVLWPNRINDTFNLGFSISLEPKTHKEPLKISTQLAPGFATARLNLEQLARPVTINRSLIIDPASLSSPSQLLLESTEGNPLLVAASPKDAIGRVLIFTTAIDTEWTNLFTKPMFVPLIQETMRVVLDDLKPVDAYHPGDQPILTGRWTNESSLTQPDGQNLLLVKQKIVRPRVNNTTDQKVLQPIPAVRPRNPLNTPGIYKGTTASLLVNVQANAGNTEANDPNALKAWLETVGPWQHANQSQPADILAKQAEQADIAWPLLWTVFALILFETFFAKHVSRGGRGATESITPPGGVTTW